MHIATYQGRNIVPY